jgi:hypothetical protein
MLVGLELRKGSRKHVRLSRECPAGNIGEYARQHEKESRAAQDTQHSMGIPQRGNHCDHRKS